MLTCARCAGAVAQIIGNKAIVEDDVSIPMKNGQMYCNK